MFMHAADKKGKRGTSMPGNLMPFEAGAGSFIRTRRGQYVVLCTSNLR